MKPDPKILAVIAACGLWLAAQAAAWSAEDTPGPAVAKIVVLNGDVKAGARGLKLGDSVAEAEEIASGRGSYATLELNDRSIVRLMADSRLRVEAHRALARQAGFETRLQLRSGAIEATVEVLGVPGFLVASSSGTITVGGGEFRARSSDDAMLVEVLSGTLTVAGTSGAQVAVGAGFGTRVKPYEAPLAPVKLLEAPNISGIAELQQRPVVRLRFAPLPGAERYRVVAATDRELREVVVENAQRRPDARMVDLRDGEYFYGVRAIDALGLEGAEARGRFRLKARPLPPAAQAPEPDAVLQPGNVTFRWAAAEEAAAYRFQLAGDEAFAAPLVNRGGLAAREIDVEKLDAGRYYWRVASVRNGGDQGPFSDAQVLSLRAEPQPLAQ